MGSQVPRGSARRLRAPSHLASVPDSTVGGEPESLNVRPAAWRWWEPERLVKLGQPEVAVIDGASNARAEFDALPPAARGMLAMRIKRLMDGEERIERNLNDHETIHYLKVAHEGGVCVVAFCVRPDAFVALGSSRIDDNRPGEVERFSRRHRSLPPIATDPADAPKSCD